MDNCLFCNIGKDLSTDVGATPSTKVYSDKHTYAFLDINPVNPGHTLLIPKKHSRNLFDIDNETLQQLTVVLKKLSIAIKNGVSADGVNIHINNEPAAGQVIFHTHLHIIPRFLNDDIKMWQGKKYKEGEIEEIAKKIKKYI